MKKRIVAGLAVVGVALLAVGWFFGWFGEDPALAEMRALQAKMEQPGLTEETRRAMWTDLRAKMETLSPAARRNLWEGNRERFAQRMESRIDRILAMPSAQRTAALDEAIDRMERFRAEAQRRNQQGNAGQRPGDRAGRQARRGNPSDEQRIARMKNRLDRSTPQMRAKRNEFFRLLSERRQQRGLPPMTRFRGRG